MDVIEDSNPWDEYYISASLTTGFVAELVQALRNRNQLDLRKSYGAGAPKSLATFSLSGFTAN